MLVILKSKKFLVIGCLFLLTLASFSKDNITLKWIELVPKFAYSFIPEEGVSDEMWEDEDFLKKVENAGLMINKEIIVKEKDTLVFEFELPGYDVVGFDINSQRINELKSGVDLTLEVNSEELNNRMRS